MPDLSTYTGPAPNAFALSVMDALEADGFRIETTPQRPRGGERKTLRITWRGIWVGLMTASMWSQKKDPYACLYRFPKSEGLASVAGAPTGFNKEAFAQSHDCDASMLDVRKDNSGSYLWVRDEVTTLRLMRGWARRIDAMLFQGPNDGETGRVIDVSAILEDKSLSDTERVAEVALRLGQGRFREQLLKEYGNACAVTGISLPSILRASHIVPWNQSTGVERCDPNNGLLLSANVDALFDRYMITFRPDGALVVSHALMPRDLERIGPLSDLQRMPDGARGSYLRRHNAQFEVFEQRRLSQLKTAAV